MAEFKPTISQAQAIESRGSAVLVSAGAGSGKTRVLTERLMAYICDTEHPVDVDSFLIITYTRAAAAELRGRIMEELAHRLAAEPGNKRLRRQNALIQRAQIGTIHSFCAQLLRENCQMLSLSPDFKIAEEERAAAMRLSALERLLEKRYDEIDDNPNFRALADTVGEGRDDRKLQELVLSLHGRMQCHPRPDKWAAEQVALLNSEAQDIAQTPWGAEIMSAAAELARYWSGEFDRFLELIVSVPEISAAYKDNFSDTADQLREFGRALRLGWDEARQCLPINFKRLNGVKNNPDPALTDMLKARRDECKDSLKKLAESFDADSATLLNELRLTAPAMEELLNLSLDFDRAYAKDKRRAGLVDYSDLEHMAVELLCDESGAPTELARHLSRRYTEIMVDEYQDVSRVQESIFTAISREGKNLFMVGDVKQSIYRFRLADPEIFTEKYLSYPDCDRALPGEPRRILLRENFRSRREILSGANAVFSLCMSRRIGDIDYDENAALICGADWYEGEGVKPELMLLELPAATDGESPDKSRLEAEFVARKIKELVESGATVTTPKGQRPMEYGDICILLRSANAVGGVYRQALSELGIPTGGAQSGEFFRSVEISTVMSMLTLLDNPHKDIALIAVL
ncbi:MAG: UvrD-helicase domain-containing protein, partial [Oscillospiraceae bacterium]|nr:UvrD-helicase domain-containing protein [Oscillospiraceae bacterium]